MRKQIIKIGTDCSGIDAPIQALRQLKIPFKHVFSSEIDTHAIKSIKANYNPEILFGDITKRNIQDVPYIDLYVCGFPCQPFSFVGKRLGTSEKKGLIFFHCLKVIKHKLPKIFILENVKGLTLGKMKPTFKIILKKLKNIKKYNIYWKILNTKDYGIPQSRPRVFIIGILKSVQKEEFEFPKKIKMKSIKKFIDNKDNNKDKIPFFIKKTDLFQMIPKQSIFIDFNFPKHKFPNSYKWSPCFMCSSRKIWNVKKHRYMNIQEMLKLQGFNLNFKQVVSNNQLKKQLGNTMSINVLMNLFKQIFKTI